MAKISEFFIFALCIYIVRSVDDTDVKRPSFLASLTPEHKVGFAERFATRINEALFQSRHADLLQNPRGNGEMKNLNKEPGTDTISVAFDKKGHTVVAANIHSRERLPLGKKPTRSYKFETKDFELNDKDRDIIHNLHQQHPLYKNQKLTIIQQEVPGTNRDLNNQNHAEIKSMQFLRGNYIGTGIGSNKPACTLCHQTLSSNGIANNGKKGYDPTRKKDGTAVVPNWKPLNEIPKVVALTYLPNPNSQAKGQDNGQRIPSTNGRRNSIGGIPSNAKLTSTGKRNSVGGIPSNGPLKTTRLMITYPGYTSPSRIGTMQKGSQVNVPVTPKSGPSFAKGSSLTMNTRSRVVGTRSY